MSVSSKRIATEDTVWFIAFGFYLTFAVLQSSFYKIYLPKENHMNVILLILLLLMALRELGSGSLTSSDFLLLTGCGILTVNALLVGTLWSAFPWLLIFFGRRVPLKQIFCFGACCLTLLLLFVILSSHAGIIENYKRVEANRENHREYLGFLYALHPGAYAFMATALLLLVRGRSVHYVTLLLLFLGNAWIYRKTDGRLAFGLVLILLMAAVLHKISASAFRHLRWLFALVIPAFPLCGAVSLLLTLRMNSAVRWMNRLDALLTHRLTYGQRSLERFGVGLLGHKVSWVGYGLNENGLASSGEYLYVDNAYVNFLQRYGLIAFVAVMGLGTWALLLLYRSRSYELLLVFLLIMLHGLLDDRILFLSYNTMWMAAAVYIGGRQPEPAAREEVYYADSL